MVLQSKYVFVAYFRHCASFLSLNVRFRYLSVNHAAKFVYTIIDKLKILYAVRIPKIFLLSTGNLVKIS